VKNKIGCCFYVIEDAISMEAPGEVKWVKYNMYV
jgi:hypothetical protein